MKRGAEDQLTKDDEENERNDTLEPGRGFVKASDHVLAERKIRALPKRSLAGASSAPAVPAPSTSADAPSVPKFAGFTGFGASAAGSTPFSFTAPQPPITPSSAEPKLSLTGSIFGGFPSSSPAPPPVASSASNATKTFASFVGSAPSLPSQPFKPAEPKPQPQDDRMEDNDEEVKKLTDYYKALRGLNLSFMSAITDAIKSDAFVDLTSYLDHYKKLRGQEMKKYGEFAGKVKGATSGAPILEPPKPTLSMPAVPTTFAGFGSFGSPSSSSSTATKPSGGGFAFQPTAASSEKPSLFTFPPSSSASTDSSTAPSKPFTFGTSTSTASSFPFSSSAPSNLFGSSSTSSSTPYGSNLFGTNSKSDVEKPALGNANLFTGGGSTFNSSTSDKPSVSSNPFTFSGSSTNSATGPGSIGIKIEDENSSGPAGAGGAAAASAFPGFGGKPGTGTSGNPVGFGFGSPSSSPSSTSPGVSVKSTATTTSSPAFLASSSSPSLSSPFAPSQSSAISFSNTSTKEVDNTGVVSAGGSEDSTPAPSVDSEGDPAQLLRHTASVHDTQGLGEEDEDTIHEVRSKVFKMGKKEDGSQAWSDMGIGMLRVKKHKIKDARRLLLRNSSTGKIVINFNIHAGMNLSLSKNIVSFVGHDNSDAAPVPGSATPFRIRLKTEDEGSKLKAALDREIEFVKSKSV